MLKQSPLNIILLGDPAAGKATQAVFLIKKYGLVDLDMGKELRSRRQKNIKLNATLKNNTDRGNLAPTKIVQDIYKDIIKKNKSKKGILFDGNPKMLVEAKFVNGLLKQTGSTNTIFIYLSIPVKETIKRMANRVEYFKGKFSKRPDDSIEALKNRVAYYRKNVSAVVKFFKSKYPYKKISGLGSQEEVKKKINFFISQNFEK